MKNFKKLNKRVVKWAKEKGILEKATPLAQIDKTLEEVMETREAIFAKQNEMISYTNSKGVLKSTNEEIKDGFGDQLVTILIGCKLQGLNPLKCLEESLDIIEKRTGKMVDGKFVKDEKKDKK